MGERDVARAAAPALAALVRSYPPRTARHDRRLEVARLSATDEATPKDAA